MNYINLTFTSILIIKFSRPVATGPSIYYYQINLSSTVYKWYKNKRYCKRVTVCRRSYKASKTKNNFPKKDK